jgi:hypothetical protein
MEAYRSYALSPIATIRPILCGIFIGWGVAFLVVFLALITAPPSSINGVNLLYGCGIGGLVSLSLLF